MGKILLCDDEDTLLRSLGRILRAVGHEVVATDGPGGLARLQQDRFDLVLTDIRMPGVSGFEILTSARTLAPGTPVIAMSGSAEIPDAVKAMHAGARDFLIKPFDVQTLEDAVAVVLKPIAPPAPSADPRTWRQQFAPWMLGDDPAMMPVLSLLSQVSDTRCTVLITGESGTGKELAARSLHAGSSRTGKPFIAVNCAAIPSTLVESELFGHVKGAFTGATSNRLGRFAQADGGTIFLDEIGEMVPDVQAKLLRLIQDGELLPVGEETPTKIDVRILAATNRNLENEVANGRFRADLYWRLNVIPVEMPNLAQRPTDIVRLAEHFLARANERHRRQVVGLDPQAIAALKAYSWPGNIRELENALERIVIVKGSGIVGLADLPSQIRSPRETTPMRRAIPELPQDGTDLRAMLEAVEDRMIGEALERTGGNKNRAAELLGLNRTTLVEKLRRKRTVTQF
ncbi:MAG: two component, sigma54 specific, transcriptional regulator, Fis family [Myxococcales bacterium]|nr:two component, sigma54 specific, transcriptional regulator, Fis family [Myxococcales bacterium]